MGSGGSPPVKPFIGDDPSYLCEDYLNAIKSSMILIHGTEAPEGSNNALMWKTKRMALIQTTLTGSAQHWFSFLTQDVKLNWEEFCKQFIKKFESNKSKNYAQIELGNVVRLPNETIKALAMRITKLVGKAYPNHKNETRNKEKNTFIKALQPPLKTVAIKKMSSHESTPENPDIPYKDLVERIDKEESRLRLADRYTDK